MHRISTRFGGFTVVELVLVIAVMGLFVGLFIINIEEFVESAGRKSPEEVLIEAVTSARLTAITNRQDVFLSFNKEATQFEITDVYGTLVQSIKTDPEDFAFVEDIFFWGVTSDRYRSGGGRSDVGDLTDEPLRRIAFEPTGVSTHVSVQWEYDRSVADDQWTYLDPFSNATRAIDE